MKTALVTGASRGIGLAIARELGVNGYQVAVMATRGESFYPESTRTLRDAGISYAWYAGDIGKSEDRIRIVREAAEHFGEIHVLVNNAGVAPKVRTDLLDMTEESFDYVIGTNTKGTMFMTQTEGADIACVETGKRQPECRRRTARHRQDNTIQQT